VKLITKSAGGITGVAVLASALLSGCGGKAANPVSIWQPGDQKLSCNSLMHAMQESETSIRKLIPESEKTGKNVALGAAGIFFFPAWFFMDLSSAEKAEIDDHRSRYNHLARIYMDKGCGNAKGKEVIQMPALFKKSNQ
jgi:hypothetical protein